MIIWARYGTAAPHYFRYDIVQWNDGGGSVHAGRGMLYRYRYSYSADGAGSFSWPGDLESETQSTIDLESDSLTAKDLEA